MMLFPFENCHCGSLRFAPGPRGGASQNISCVACGHQFNVALLPGHRVLFVNDLGPGEPPPRVPWTIELEQPCEPT